MRNWRLLNIFWAAEFWLRGVRRDVEFSRSMYRERRRRVWR